MPRQDSHNTWNPSGFEVVGMSRYQAITFRWTWIILLKISSMNFSPNHHKTADKPAIVQEECGLQMISNVEIEVVIAVGVCDYEL
ncbi:hypothetical protein TB2_034846 [Malus domestica]